MSNEAINFTDNAAAKVYQLIQEEGNFDLNLRIFVTGGGCSGFQYNFTFDDAINDDDEIVVKMVTPDDQEEGDQGDEGGGDSGTAGDGIPVRLLVDPISFQYLIGAEIDYRKDVNGAQFVIRNPNAKTTCGCGSSFSA